MLSVPIQPMPAKGKVKLQALIPEALFTQFEQFVAEHRSDKSKMLEYILSSALDNQTVFAKLAPEELEQLQLLAQRNRRSLEQQAAFMIAESLGQVEQQ